MSPLTRLGDAHRAANDIRRTKLARTRRCRLVASGSLFCIGWFGAEAAQLLHWHCTGSQGAKPPPDQPRSLPGSRAGLGSWPSLPSAPMPPLHLSCRPHGSFATDPCRSRMRSLLMRAGTSLPHGAVGRSCRHRPFFIWLSQGDVKGPVTKILPHPGADISPGGHGCWPMLALGAEGYVVPQQGTTALGVPSDRRRLEFVLGAMCCDATYSLPLSHEQGNTTMTCSGSQVGLLLLIVPRPPPWRATATCRAN